MLISSQSSYLENKMETLKTDVPKIGKNVARKSTSNRPLKNIPNVKSKTEVSAFSPQKIVKLSPSSVNHYSHFEGTRYSPPQTYHLSNSARYSDHIINKPVIVQDRYIDDSEEECDNIDGVFSISGSMMKYLKEAQMSPSLSEDSDDAVEPCRVLNFPVKYEFPSFAIKQIVPCFSDEIFGSEESELSDSDKVEVPPNSIKKKVQTLPVSPAKAKVKIKKELTFGDNNTDTNSTEEVSNENICDQMMNTNAIDSSETESSFNLKIEFITTLTNEDNDLAWQQVSDHAPDKEANVLEEIAPVLDTNVEENTGETNVEEDIETNVGEKNIETNVEERITEADIGEKTAEAIKENTVETIGDDRVETTEENSVKKIQENAVNNEESNNFEEPDSKIVTNVNNKTNKDKEIKKEATIKKTVPTSNKGKVTKLKTKPCILPKRTTRSTAMNLVEKTIEDSLVKRVPSNRKSKQTKAVSPPPVPPTKRGRPFSNRRSKANLNLAEESSDNSDSNLSSSDETENKTVSEKTNSKGTEKSKSEIAPKKSKSEAMENTKSEVISSSEKPKENKKIGKIKPEINEGILLHVEAAKKTNIMRDGKILKDKKDLLKDVDSTIDKNLPLEVDKQDFEIQQSLTEQILLDQALRLAHQRTSPRRRPLLTTSQAKEIVNSLTSQSRTRRKSTEKKTLNSSGSPGKEMRSSDTNLNEADLSNTAETESDSEMKQESSVDETSPSKNKSGTSSNLKKQDKKSSKPKKINIKSILKKMADTLDPDNVDINSLSKTFENVIKNISTLTNLSNSEPSDSDTQEEKKVNTKPKRKTKTRKKAKSNSTHVNTEDDIKESELPSNDQEELVPVIIIKNKNEAFLRKRSQRISNSISNKDEDNDTVIQEIVQSPQDSPKIIPEKIADDSKDETSLSGEITSISQDKEKSEEPVSVISNSEPSQKVTTSEETQNQMGKLILDESCKSLVIDESLNESSLNPECKSVTDSTPLPESSSDEVTSTTEIDKTENTNREEEGPIIIEDSPASPDEIYVPPEPNKSEAIDIIEIDDVEVDSSTKTVEGIPFLDNCDTTVFETGNDFHKDDSSQMSFNSVNSDSIKETVCTPIITDGSPTKFGKFPVTQENCFYNSDSSGSTSHSAHQETTADQVTAASNALLGNAGLQVPSSLQNTPIQCSTSVLHSAVSNSNPAVYTNVAAGGLNISPAINIFSQPNSYSLSSDATQITTSIVTTSTLLQHISQQSLTSSINPLDPAYNANSHLANYFNQNQQNFQYPLATNSVQYSSSSSASSSSEVTKIAQTNATSSSTALEEPKPKPKSIDVPLSILARDPRLRRKSVRIIVDNVEFTAPAASSNPAAPSVSDPRGLVAPRVPSASTASATPKVQAVAPFSKQDDTGEVELAEPEITTQEDNDNFEEGNEKRPDSPVLEVPKKKSKKKEIDKELLYKTPLCDLHEETSERSSYSRKPKRTGPSRFDRPSEAERSYTHHDPYREHAERIFHPNSDAALIIHGINPDHYNEESREYPPAAFRRFGEKTEGHRRKEEFPQHSRRPDHYFRREYEDSKRRDTSDRRPLLEHSFGRYNQRYKDYSPDQSTDYKYRRSSNDYPRYDYAHKKVDGKFPSHLETGDADEDGQTSSRPYYRRRHFNGSGGFNSSHQRDEEELFKRRWEGADEDWRPMMRSFRDRSPSFSRTKRVERAHGPGRGAELESPLSPDQEPPLYQ